MDVCRHTDGPVEFLHSLNSSHCRSLSVGEIIGHSHHVHCEACESRHIQGSDHHGTIARVRCGLQCCALARQMSIPKEFPEYILHKMLSVVKDGEPVKMSKRSGNYVTLRDLVDMAGQDAASFFLVARKADAEFVFDINLARLRSVLLYAFLWLMAEQVPSHAAGLPRYNT